MKKQKNMNWYKNKHFFIAISTTLVLTLLVAVAVGTTPRNTGNPQSAQPAGAAGDFLKSQGYNLYYGSQKVVLKGANFDNIGALGNSIGTNPSMDAIDTTEDDYTKMASLGGNHARLGLSFVWYKNNQTRFFQEMDNQLSWAHNHGIWVTLNMFTTPGDCYEGYGNSCAFWGSSSEQSQLEQFWVAVASRYKNEPALAGYDLLNEPTPGASVGWSCSTWFNIAQRIRNSVTAADPNHLVFIEACSDPSFDRVFKNADGSKATNVVYEVHDYDPMSISHTESTSAQYPGTHAVWTISGVEKSIYLNKAQFAGTGGDPDYSTYKKYSIEWAKQNAVPIYVGEWGARAYANSYIQYIKDKGELYGQWEANQSFYTWEHDVSGYWRWGIFQSQRGGMSTTVNNDKLNAFLVSLQGAVRPNFGTGGVTPGSTPPPTTPGTSQTPPPTAPPNNSGSGVISLSTPLSLNVSQVNTGGTVTGRVVYKNTGTAAITISDMAVAARPPGGTNATGPYLDFSPYLASQGGKTLQPGESFTFTATKTFNSSDPTGSWYAFSTYQVNGTWYDAPTQYNVPLSVNVAAPQVTPTPNPSSTVSTPTPRASAGVPEPPSSTGYPRKLQSSSSQIDLYETRAPQGNTVFIEARPSSTSTKTFTQVDWYVNNRWTSSDKSTPFALGWGGSYTLSGSSATIRAVVYYNSNWNYIDATVNYSLGGGGSTNPVVTPIPTSNSTTGYPRELSGTNPALKIYETQPRQGNTVFLKLVPSGVDVKIVAWYVNGGWAAEDRTNPFSLGSDTSGFNLGSSTATIRAAAFTDYNYNSYVQTTVNYR